MGSREGRLNDILGQSYVKVKMKDSCGMGASHMLMVNNLPANVGDIKDTGSIPRSGSSPEGGHGNPLQYSCLENPHGQRSLVGYSPWGRKELDTTE